MNKLDQIVEMSSDENQPDHGTNKYLNDSDPMNKKQ